jgi:RNA polymerase sigma factor (TIGR02999 family)
MATYGKTTTMSDVTQILTRIDAGDSRAAEELLPLVYDELRHLAARKLAGEKPGQTLEATALVHEAYLRLVGSEEPHWTGRTHFFAAAAEAMRRILVDNARRKRSQKRGGNVSLHRIDEGQIAAPEPAVDLVALDEALVKLSRTDKQMSELVKLRYFAGFTIPQAAKILGVSPRTADRLWACARAWLYQEMQAE